MNRILFYLVAAFALHLPCRAVVYTSNQCMDGTASASSQWSSVYAADYAFDAVFGSANGWYTASGNQSGWLAYEFAEPKTILKYSVFNRDYSTAATSAPKDWTFEAFDGTDWIVLDTQSDQTAWGIAEERSFIVSNSQSYSKYRMNITANNGAVFLGFAELEMYEEALYIGGEGPESIWCFGFGAGLDFRYDPPLAVDGSNMDQWEGCASISNENGELLFYTNGVNVWDANHSLMPNGTGLYGSSSSSQSGVIIPQPGNSDLYYVFTLDRNGDYEVGHKGLCYSVVDMSLNSGSGDVISAQKNIELNNPNTEKITAVIHENDEDIWILTHDWGNNKFLAYLLSSSGLNTTPVESAVGFVHYDSFNGWCAGGYMKVSPNGDKIALNILGAHTTQLFDFNPATGVVSNPMTLSTTRHQAYGLEFSPDASKLYTTAWEHNNILQYDLSLGDEASIAASETEIGVSAVSGGSNYSGLGAMQLGPDARIYVSKDANGIGGNVNALNGWLGYIENPNSNMAKSIVSYVDKGVYLGGNASGIGLPVFIQSFFKPLPVDLLSFHAIDLDNQQVDIVWKTVSETNADYFELQSANQNMQFSTIYTCNAKGNSEKLQSYHFVDDKMFDVRYFRLLQYDLNGDKHYLGMLAVQSTVSEFSVEAFPNPTTEILNIECEVSRKETIYCTLFDAYGKTVKSVSFNLSEGRQVNKINVSDLPAGMYYLQVIGSSEVLFNRSIQVGE